MTVLCTTSVCAKHEQTEVLSQTAKQPFHAVRETASQGAYMMKAAFGEFDALLQYIGGKNPTEGKPIEAKGQNTKRNTATTVIDIFKKTRPAAAFHYQLVPYPGKADAWELCLFYTPPFGTEQVVHTGLLHDYGTQTIYRVDGTGILGIGYDFNFDFDTFYAADDPWQRNFGFCPLYDALALMIGDVYETIRVPFRYDGRDWMIQIWKGIYSGNMLGAEIGIYNKPLDRTTQYYDCAADPDRAEMSFSVWLGDELIVESEHKTAWWQTAFTYHSPAKPADLTLNGRLTFQKAAMAKAFADSLAQQEPSVRIERSGRDVRFIW